MPEPEKLRGVALIKEPKPAAKAKRRYGRWFFTFGVVLPLLAVIFETTTHFCAQNFFDPFPSNGHVLLFLLIPFSNYLTWLSSRRDLSQHCFFMALVSGMAMGIGCLYTLMFLPITPTCCMWSLALGFGLLGLAPVLSLPCSWLSGKAVCNLAESQRTYFSAHQVEHIGHLIILVMVIAVELPSTMTRVHLAEATKGDVPAITWLRRWGSKEVLLRACYERSGRATDILGSLYENSHPISVEAARDVFYKVTGQAYNSVALPASARATLTHAGIIANASVFNEGVEDEFDLDNDVAGESVATVARGLSAKEVTVSGGVNNTAALATINWSIDFDNKSKYDREGRLKLLLPRDAVVSGATITMDGKTRDATILAREEARAIYRANAEKKLDPLLVSVCGRDQILIQAYPIRPASAVKINLEIQAPVQIDPQGNEVLALPGISEKNFQMGDAVKLDIKSASKYSELPATMVQRSLVGAPTAGDRQFDYELTGTCPLKDLTTYGAFLHWDKKVQNNADGSAPVVYTWLINPQGPTEYIERTLLPVQFPSSENINIVVDGSVSMKDYLPQIAKALEQMDGNARFSLRVVGDQTEMLLPPGSTKSSPEFQAAIKKLSEYKAQGGQDGTEDILLIYSLVRNDADILWIHGPQPLRTDFTFSAGPGRGKLYDLQVVAGPNVLGEASADSTSFIPVPRYKDLTADLSALLRDLARPTNTATACVLIDGQRVTPPPPPPPCSEYKLTPAKDPGMEVDQRLAQIWVNQAVAQAAPEARQGFAPIVNQLHVVTPISSAVVIPTVEDKMALHPPIPRKTFTAAAREAVKEAGRLLFMRTIGAMSILNAVGPMMQNEELKQKDVVLDRPAWPQRATDSLSAAAPPAIEQNRKIASAAPAAAPEQIFDKKDMVGGKTGGGDSFGGGASDGAKMPLAGADDQLKTTSATYGIRRKGETLVPARIESQLAAAPPAISEKEQAEAKDKDASLVAKMQPYSNAQDSLGAAPQGATTNYLTQVQDERPVSKTLRISGKDSPSSSAAVAARQKKGPLNLKVLLVIFFGLLGATVLLVSIFQKRQKP